MTDDKQQEKSLEKGTEQKTATYKPDADEARAAGQATADKYKADMDKRIDDYESGAERESSSYGLLKQVPITIFDGDSTVVGHGVRGKDAGAFPQDGANSTQDTAGRRPGETTRPGTETNEVGTGRVLHPNPDGSSTLTNDKGQIVETTNRQGGTSAYGYDADGKLNEVTTAGRRWTTADGMHWTSDDGQTIEQKIEVLPDGSRRHETDQGTVVFRLDDRVERTARNESVIVSDPSGRVENTVDANGKTRFFEYGANGKLSSVTEETGVKWTTTDGETWTTMDGRTWKGTIKVERDGTYRYTDEKLQETIKKPDGSVTYKESNGRITETAPDGTSKEVQKPIDREKLERLAEEMHGDEGIGPSFGGDMMREQRQKDMYYRGETNERLKDLSDSEREALKGIYHQKYGQTLESDYKFLHGEDKEKFHNLFKKSDDPMQEKADKLRAAIDRSRDDYSWYSYKHTDRPNNANDEVRNTLKNMNADEIKEMDNYYKRVYGESLHHAINSDTPKATREMCDIYLKGNENQTDEDRTKLDELKKQEELDVEGVPDSKLTSEELNEVFDKNFTRLDKDKDGFVSKDEIDRAMKDPDYKGKDAQLVAVLKEHREELEELSNDETGDENDGVTRKDMDELSRLADKTNKSKEEQELVGGIDGSLHASGKHLEYNRNLWGEHNNPIDSIKPEAVQQNKRGDCFFLAAVAAQSNTPEGKEKLKNMIEDNGDGTYTVTFPGDPKHPVTVDEPTQAELAYGAENTSENGMWVAVLEKAYGKYQEKHGSEDHRDPTDSISDGGYGNDALKMLTGDDVDNDRLLLTRKETTHEKLKAAMAEGRPVVASTPHELGEDVGLADGKTDGSGIPTTHEYTVTGYDPNTRMVKLRNPWGSGEPMKDGKAADGKDDGEFEMTLDEFHKEFEDVDYAKHA